jgi:hypothetical protein
MHENAAGQKADNTKMAYPVLGPQIRKQDGAISPRVPGKPALEYSVRVFLWFERKLAFFRLLFAAASMILRPVNVEPVKATLSTSI